MLYIVPRCSKTKFRPKWINFQFFLRMFISENKTLLKMQDTCNSCSLICVHTWMLAYYCALVICYWSMHSVCQPRAKSLCTHSFSVIRLFDLCTNLVYYCPFHVKRIWTNKIYIHPMFWLKIVFIVGKMIFNIFSAVCCISHIEEFLCFEKKHLDLVMSVGRLVGL